MSAWPVVALIPASYGDPDGWYTLCVPMAALNGAVRRRFVGKSALVTGAASGIGEATARRLAAEGADVIVFDLQAERARRVAAEIDGVAVAGDAAEPDDAARAVGAAIDRAGGLDVLVTCAGGDAGAAPLLDTEVSGWDAGIRLNLDTCVATTMAALPSLVARRGAIVVISSVAGLSSAPASTVYQTAKAGLLGLVRSLAVDYGPAGVRANAICPGWTRTPLATEVVTRIAAATGVTVEAAYLRATSVLPLRRAADAAEIASACAFLASSDASYITGATVVVDGGTMALNAGAAAFGSPARDGSASPAAPQNEGPRDLATG